MITLLKKFGEIIEVAVMQSRGDLLSTETTNRRKLLVTQRSQKPLRRRI